MRSMIRGLSFRFFASLLPLLLSMARAEDWPQFLGPRRDGSYAGELAATWPKEGPERSWQVPVGNGFAGPVVVKHRVFLFHRTGGEERLECFDAANGKSLWVNGYAATYRDDFGFDPGPRATPAVAEGRVFCYGADGVISAVNAADGKLIWRMDAKKEFGSKKGFFGRAPSPLVYGDLVLLNVGGEGAAGIVALEAATGKTRWKASKDEASYSSPVVAVFDGKTNVLFLTRHELVGIDPLKGEIGFRYAFAPTIEASVSAATPLVDGDLIFISGSYGAGAAALRVAGGKVKEVWRKEDVLSNHYATSVHRGRMIFGFDGRQDVPPPPALVCLNWDDGTVAWRKESYGAGSLVIAGERLLILMESGELILAEASSAAYKELGRAQILGAQTRAFPALADGFLYARSKDKMVRVKVGK
jgi:outer membrane protein assembly factor BamB